VLADDASGAAAIASIAKVTNSESSPDTRWALSRGEDRSPFESANGKPSLSAVPEAAEPFRIDVYSAKELYRLRPPRFW
jgi:hypothetical protein